MRFFTYFTRRERRGLLFLFLIILALQLLTIILKHTPYNTPLIEESIEEHAFLKHLDSLRHHQQETQSFKMKPYNPNYISDYKGYVLGMTPEEIDRLHRFRTSGQWINSSKAFQEVTGVSDSLLDAISPLFKFPDWVSSGNRYQSTKSNLNKTFDQKKDLNLATARELQHINGVGEVLSQRIINYRKRFDGGFIDDVQLIDIYGLSNEVIQRIKQEFTVKTPREIHQVNLNTATVDQLVEIQHIDYELAYNIIEHRTLRTKFQTLDELTNVNDFPTNKLEIIRLYLYIN